MNPFEESCSRTSRKVLRPQVRGKFLFVNDQKFYVRGVTYGTFRPDEDGHQYRDPEVIEQDFAQMAANGINAVRTYTVPPPWLLDAAQRHGLMVMVGLPWEEHITFLDDKRRAKRIEERVRASIRDCAGHPAVLCYAIGNEIPTPIVRWHGHRAVGDYMKRLWRAAKCEDPSGLFTYVNYPSTEYLQLPFLDIVCFNVYLESQERFEAYLARLHNLVGNRPLIIAEAGLDSRRHGEEGQARALDWQIRTAFVGGCAGTFVFAWTDEWHRGGYDIEDWDFGLTRRDRRAKPALAAVRHAFDQAPFPADVAWPRVSVVICTCNGERTIRECFNGLAKLDYPNFEVIVIDDGSTDGTAEIAQEFGFRVISTPNGGLSAARNVGFEAATGEIVAYIDDDAYPDPQWLKYLASAFQRTKHAGVGGPNIAPHGDGPIADCVANAPGGPVHVLLSDVQAEHIPGCNMAFRKSCLKQVGGFDPQFRAAGDDVDLCWRLQHQGATLGFSPAAVVFHHRRNSVRAYWKQQVGYGKAEALLERKWPGKYNAVGHLTWTGRVYDSRGVIPAPGWGRGRIYQGIWGSAPYQSLYQPAASALASLPLMPEWYLVIAALTALSAIGTVWRPLLYTLPMLALAIAAPTAEALMSTAQASFTSAPASLVGRIGLRGLTACLHLLQPLARLYGRLRYGLTPWRGRGSRGFSMPRVRTVSIWNEQWQPPEVRLRFLEAALRADGRVVVFGGDYDPWDLEVRGGMLGAARTLMAIEEHGAGRQMVRFRSWPRCAPLGAAVAALLAALCMGAVLDRAWIASGLLGATALLLSLRLFRECSAASAALHRVLKQCGTQFGSAEADDGRRLAKEASSDSVFGPEEEPAPLGATDFAPARVQRIVGNEEGL